MISIFTAEAIAIWTALKNWVSETENYIILTDSLSVLKSIQNINRKSNTIILNLSSTLHQCLQIAHSINYIHLGTSLQGVGAAIVTPTSLIYSSKKCFFFQSEANPQVYVETPSHPEKLTVWCALWAGGIIGPYFFKNDEGHNVTVNGDRYRAMITNFFIPELNNHDVQELWFQQDGATCHTACATIDLLKDTFGDRLISRFGPVNWPPRSCDLTPLDYFLWGYVKSLVYADKPQTLDHLEDNIRRVIADIRPQMLEKVIENWTSRLDYIRASRGSPMPEIIFKMYLPQDYLSNKKKFMSIE
ncbi:uncharacterized protein TNCV_1575621 [Trichonephila clavipes]|nr:uncharacterized protein TNCV_1575621 [Trichonephila clavipes]